jgi:hypothetical protein
MLPFEIRDLKFDMVELSTIPQKLGIKKTKCLGVVILLICVLLEFLKDEIQVGHVLGMLLISVITGLFVLFSRIEQSKYYSVFWVEAIPILWLFLLLVFNRNFF